MTRAQRPPEPDPPAPPPTSLRPIDALSVLRAIHLGMFPRPRIIPSRPDLGLEDLVDALKKHDWHAQRVARELRVGRATLWRCLKRLGLSLREQKKPVVFRRYIERTLGVELDP